MCELQENPELKALIHTVTTWNCPSANCIFQKHYEIQFPEIVQKQFQEEKSIAK